MQKPIYKMRYLWYNNIVINQNKFLRGGKRYA